VTRDSASCGAVVKFRFKEFRIYQEAKDYCTFCRTIVGGHIRRKDPRLSNQIERALISIILNIAEGSAASSDAEFARFINMSMKSLYETVAGFDLAAHYGYIEPTLNETIEKEAHTLAKQLASFSNVLK
jgi:four helix bundle protein